MSVLICPNCKGDLLSVKGGYKCVNGHCFDKAKQGYVNLLLSQKSSLKRHGDDGNMVKARTEFLSGGFYKPLLEKICETVIDSISYGEILDVGCGEGYYTCGVYEALKNADISFGITGIDISKEAIKNACKRNNEIKFAVASSAQLPIKDNSVKIIINIFAPHSDGEFHRVLEENGLLIRVIPLENHLFSLKAAVYDKPYLNVPDTPVIEGFKQINRTDLKYSFKVCESQIQNLFKMTPYYYKTSKLDEKKLLKLKELETEAEFAVLLYKKS